MTSLMRARPPATDFPRRRAELERGIALGWHTGAQLYASVRGETVADFALGEARPGVAMTSSTIVEWAVGHQAGNLFSGGAALAAWALRSGRPCLSASS